MKTVLVVGGGLAGLSAALRLVDGGVRVRVLEKRAIAGGRAYSYRAREAGHVVDNGQHLMMGCYERTLAFLDRTGARDRLEAQPRLSVPVIDGAGASGVIAAAPLPSPLHLGLGAMRYRLLSPRERCGLLAGGIGFVLRHGRGRGPAGETVAAALAALRQGERSRVCFWNPLAIAVMNEAPERASARLFAEVLRRVFFAPAASSRLVFPRVGLSELLVDPAVAAIERAGGVVDVGQAAAGLVASGDRIAGVRLARGGALEADAVVLAVPPPALGGLLPETLRGHPSFSGIAAFEAAPIVSVHLWLRDRVPTPRMVGFLEGPLQWLFTPPMQPPEGSYVTLVSSGARELVDRSPDEVLEHVRRTLARFLPQAAGIPWSDALVAKERAATFAATPGEQALRPGAKTPLRNLVLAGDWTDTGLPATIEGAIASGERAAGAVLASVRP